MLTDSPTYNITGTLVAYYYICNRKLWLYAKGLNLENISGNVDVIKGKVLHETRYERETRKEYDFDRTKIDFLRYGDEVIIHEIKKSKKFEDAHIWQIKYYIFTLRTKGILCSAGVIHYPSHMRKIDIEYTNADDQAILEAIEGIIGILNLPKPPEFLNKGFCKKCAYFDFCSA